MEFVLDGAKTQFAFSNPHSTIEFPFPCPSFQYQFNRHCNAWIKKKKALIPSTLAYSRCVSASGLFHLPLSRAYPWHKIFHLTPTPLLPSSHFLSFSSVFSPLSLESPLTRLFSPLASFAYKSCM